MPARRSPVCRKEFAMPRSSPTLLTAFVALVALTAPPGYGAGLGLKPGLWEVRPIKQVVDGHDMSAQMAAALAQAQQALANLPPEQRAQVQSMLNQNGISRGGDGSFRICVSPEMAKRDTPILDRNGRCQPGATDHNGNKTTFQFSCGFNGTTMAGKGEASVAGDVITTRTNTTT